MHWGKGFLSTNGSFKQQSSYFPFILLETPLLTVCIFHFWQFTGKDHERAERNHFGQDGHVLDLSFFEICDPEFSKIKESGNVWASITDLEPKLLAHQIKAFEFIWKNLAGSLQLEEMDGSTSRGGCAVAHTPGAGKTLLLISFLVSYLKVHTQEADHWSS
jgi:hypothetical protein